MNLWPYCTPMLSLPRDVLELIAETPGIWAALHHTCRELLERTVEFYTITRKPGRGEEYVLTRVSTLHRVYFNIWSNGKRICLGDDLMPSLVAFPSTSYTAKFVVDDYAFSISSGDIVVARHDRAYLLDRGADILHNMHYLFYDKLYKVVGVHTEFRPFTPPAPFAYAAGQKIMISESSQQIDNATALLLERI